MENIKEIETLVVENTTGPAADNIETTDENLSVDAMFQQSLLPSLGRQIFSVLPIHGPTAGLFNLKKKAVGNDLELVRNDVQVYPSESIKTGLSQEAIQDLKSQYGKTADIIIGKLLRGLANEQENTRTLAFLTSNSVEVTSGDTLTLTSSTNAELIVFEISQKVHELILKANGKNLRTYDSYCVLPYQAAAAFAALNQYIGGMDKDERGLFIAEIGNTKFYMNPNPSATTAFVGLKDSENPSKSAAVFSPYQSQIIEALDSSTGAMTYHIFNRFAITASPLHETGNEMMYKFEIA